MNRSRIFSQKIWKIIIPLAASLFAGSVQAEWVALGRNENFRVYLDPRSIQRNGEYVQIGQLMDFTSAQRVDTQTVVGSIKSLVEYDCSQPRFRTLISEAYSEQMGNGLKVASDQLPDPQWESIDPASTSGKIRQIACEQR